MNWWNGKGKGKNKTKTAFTLLEVILVLALLGIVLLTVNEFLRSNVRVYKKTAQLQEEQQEMILVKSYFEEKLPHAIKIAAILDEDKKSVFENEGEAFYVVFESPEFETETRAYNAYTVFLKKQSDSELGHKLMQGYLNLNSSLTLPFYDLSDAEQVFAITQNDTNTPVFSGIRKMSFEKLIAENTGKVKGIILYFETIYNQKSSISIEFQNLK